MAQTARVNGHLVVNDLERYNASALRDFVEVTLRLQGYKFSRVEKRDKHGKKVAIYIPQLSRVDEEENLAPTIHVFNRPQGLEEWAEGLDAEGIIDRGNTLRSSRVALFKGRIAQIYPEHYPAGELFHLALMLEQELSTEERYKFSRGFEHFLFDNGQVLISPSLSLGYHEFITQMCPAA